MSTPADPLTILPAMNPVPRPWVIRTHSNGFFAQDRDDLPDGDRSCRRVARMAFC